MPLDPVSVGTNELRDALGGQGLTRHCLDETQLLRGFNRAFTQRPPTLHRLAATFL